MHAVFLFLQRLKCSVCGPRSNSADCPSELGLQNCQKEMARLGIVRQEVTNGHARRQSGFARSLAAIIEAAEIVLWILRVPS
jgi:hypothetical protein